MTKIDELMALADVYAASFGDPRNDVVERKALRAALEAALKPGEPEDSDRVMTVVYRDPTKDEVQSFMDHPKAVWFGWCHAPYQRDQARRLLEAAPPAQTPPPRLTVEQLYEILSSKQWADDEWDYERAIESAVRKQLGVNDE